MHGERQTGEPFPSRRELEQRAIGKMGAISENPEGRPGRRRTDGAIGADRQSERLGVADGNAENAAVGRLHHRSNEIAMPVDRH